MLNSLQEAREMLIEILHFQCPELDPNGDREANSHNVKIQEVFSQVGSKEIWIGPDDFYAVMEEFEQLGLAQLSSFGELCVDVKMINDEYEILKTSRMRRRVYERNNP